MTIGMLQTMSKVNLNVTTSKTSNVSSKTNSTNEKFDRMFNEAMTNSSSKTYTDSKQSSTDTLNTTKDVLEADTLEEGLDALGIEHDDSMLSVVVDGEEIPTDQLLDIDALLAILNIDGQDLQDIMQKLSMDGSETVDLEDIWSVIDQGLSLMDQISSAIQGEGESAISQEDANKLLQLLKLAQLAGNNSDLQYQQQYTLTTLKEQLTTVATEVLPVLQPLQSTQANQPIRTVLMTPTIQEVVSFTSTETNGNAANASNQEGLMQQNQQSSQGIKTVNITLPTNPASQSEALTKQIENLLNRSQLSNNQGTGTIKLMLKLFPENLGQIRIEIMQQNGVMTARLLASTAAGKELLDSNLNSLKTAFVAQNIQMDRIDIAQSLQETDRNLRDQNLFGNFFNQQSQEDEDESEDQTDEEQKSFSELLNEEVQV